MYYRILLIFRISHISASDLILLFYLLPDVFKNYVQVCKSSIPMCYFLPRESDEVIVLQSVRNVISEFRNGLSKEDFFDKPLNAGEIITKLSPALPSVLDTSSVNAIESVLQ